MPWFQLAKMLLVLGIIKLTMTLGLGVALPLERNKALPSESDEYYYDDDTLLSAPSLCDEFCSYTYPAHTYPVVGHKSACRQGCLLAQLFSVSLGDCRKDCLTLFTSEAEQYACHVGCNKLPPPQQDRKFQTVSAVAVVRETHIVKESLKRLENNDETFNKNIEGLANLRYTTSNLQGGAISVLDLPVDIQSAMQSFNFSQLDEFSVVYISESIQHTMVNNTPFDYYKLRFSIGAVLILLGGYLLLLSQIRKNAEEAEQLAKKETVRLSFKAGYGSEIPSDNVGLEFLPKKLSKSPPISITL